MTDVPLTTLLSWTWIAHAMEVDNAVEAAWPETSGRPFRISLAMWTNGLRCISADGVALSDVRRATRASCNVAGLERWGWITVGDGTGRRREGYGTERGLKPTTTLRPTRAGSEARKLWPRTVTAVETMWRRRFGEGTIDALRSELVRRAADMPWSPPEVHAADGFRTHVIEAEAPADGEAIPLVALLGQALTERTLEGERDALVSLPLVANLLRVIGVDGIATRDLPARSGVSKEAVVMALAFAQRRDLAIVSADRAVGLTSRGREALNAYIAYGEHEDDHRELRAALTAVLDRRETLAAGLVPHAKCWRAQRPYLAQTQRLLADPTGALPRHPMVLHRGGWPDGS